MLNGLPRDFSSLLSTLFCNMQYPRWVGQFVESLIIKIRHIGVGDGEVKKINFQQHPQGLLESQKTPPHHHPVGPDHLLASITRIRCFLFPDVPMSMFNFNLLFLGETGTNIAWRLICDTGVVSLARFPACGAIIVGIEKETEVTTFR